MAQNGIAETLEEILSTIKEMTAGDAPFVATIRLICYVPIVLGVLFKEILLSLDDTLPVLLFMFMLLVPLILLGQCEYEENRVKHEKCTDMATSLCSQSPSVEECFERVFPSCIDHTTATHRNATSPTTPKQPEQSQE